MLVGSVGMFVEIGIKQAYASINHQLTVHCFATYQQGRRTAPCVLRESSYYITSWDVGGWNTVMPRINMGRVSIHPKCFEPKLDIVREAVANSQLRKRIML